ncbi:hypothetical protein F4810DRAFT_659198 [Camillea tinctor]|nr:hypothetical protein F4810DRAFT_659198 [Camillea tinctor]
MATHDASPYRSRKMDDVKESLFQISRHHGRPLISLLLDISRCLEPPECFLPRFLRHLECLRVDPNDNQSPTLLRVHVNAFKDRDYVALSYPWATAGRNGRYIVQNRNKDRKFASAVRDRVFRRAIQYMRRKDVKKLWIDKHCIPQKTDCNKTACRHRLCKRKKIGLKSMNWVFKLSEHPVALLDRPLRSRRDLRLLNGILKGSFVDDTTGGLRLSMRKSTQQVTDALRVLFKITSGDWWERAWPFQETYLAGIAMILLIQHPRAWEGQKRSYAIFDNIPGELCINAVDFFTQATRLCLAFRYSTPSMTEKERTLIRNILGKTARYTVLLKKSESMALKIIRSVLEKDIHNPWDRLSIAANCCGYPERLDVHKLRQGNCSLSLSMLAMCLLNGQILHNGLASYPPESTTLSGFLGAYFFNQFRPPRIQYSLTFNKGCRFVDVKLTKDGIVTRGHVWTLGKIIETATFGNKLPFIKYPRPNLKLWEQQRLAQLSHNLKKLSSATTLASQLEYFLYKGAVSSKLSWHEKYRLTVAREIARAIREGQTLRLGSSWDTDRGSPRYTAIFIWDNDRPNNLHKAAFAFTALQPKKTGFQGHDAVGTDRHVSLEVEMKIATGQNRGHTPRLYVKSWLLGLWFTECPEREVIFPWPPGLHNVRP